MGELSDRSAALLEEPWLPLVDMLEKSEGRSIEEKLLRLGQPAVAILVDIVLTGKSEATARAAIDLLADLEGMEASAIPRLLEAIDAAGTPPDRRISAVSALGAIARNDRRAIARLRSLLRSRELKLVEAAEDALCRLGDESIVRSVVPRLLDTVRQADDSEVRWRAFARLVGLGPGLAVVLQDVADMVLPIDSLEGFFAIAGLGYSAQEGATPILVHLLRGRSAVIAREVLLAMGDLGCLARAAIPELEAVLREHWSLDVREDARAALDRIRSCASARTWFRRRPRDTLLIRNEGVFAASHHGDQGSLHCYCDGRYSPLFRWRGTWWRLTGESPSSRWTVLHAGGGWLMAAPRGPGLVWWPTGALPWVLSQGDFSQLLPVGDKVLAYQDSAVYRVDLEGPGAPGVELLVELPCPLLAHAATPTSTVIEMTDCGVYELSMAGEVRQLPCRPPCGTGQCSLEHGEACCTRPGG